MPATVLVNDLLIAIVAVPQSGAPSTPTGWTLITHYDGPSGANITTAVVFAKIAAGTEGGTTVDFTTIGAVVAVAHVYRFQYSYKASAASAVGGSSNVNGTSTSPDPASLTPAWGLDSDAWIAIAVFHSAATINAYPASYTNGTETTSGTILSLATARRTLFASSENPGAFTLSASSDWGAGTIAIRPSE